MFWLKSILDLVWGNNFKVVVPICILGAKLNYQKKKVLWTLPYLAFCEGDPPKKGLTRWTRKVWPVGCGHTEVRYRCQKPQLYSKNSNWFRWKVWFQKVNVQSTVSNFSLFFFWVHHQQCKKAQDLICF